MSDARLLPEAFMTAYEALHVRSFSDGSGSERHPLSGRAAEIERADGKGKDLWRTSSGQVSSIGSRRVGGGGSGKTVGKTSKFLGDERAWEFKRKIDKRLRRMAKEILAELDSRGSHAGGAERGLHRRCAGKCGKLGDSDWLFCARCGSPMAEVA
jgi:hypothetical protein